jgi:tight adherence protein B
VPTDGGALMGAVLGLLLGVGLLLIWTSFQEPAPRDVPRSSRLRPLLSSAGLGEVSLVGFAVVCGVCALVATTVVLVASRTVPVALVFGAMGGYLPVALLKNRARRRQRDFAEVWPEAVDNLASAVRAGMSLPEALSALSERGPEPLRDAFAGFALDYQVSGRFSDALDRLKDRLADPVGDRVVESLRVAREVGGGDLGRLLRSLSGFLRDDARTRSELEARQAWTVNGARLAVAAPWLVLLLMCFQPEVIQRYSTGAGVVVLVVGGLLCAVAYRAMVRIGRLPTERRILS